MFWQFNIVERELEQIAIIAGIAYQHRAEQTFVVSADDNAFVDFLAFIEINVAASAFGAAVCITDTADVYAQQFQLGAHICAVEAVFVAK